MPDIDPGVIRDALQEWLYQNQHVVREAITSAVWGWIQQNSQDVLNAMQHGAESATRKRGG